MKLIKTTKGHYILIDDTKETNDKDFIVGTSRDTNASKLSLKNCQAIVNGYDLDELSKEETRKFLGHDVPENIMLFITHSKMFQKGFQTAMKILGDNKFSEKDMNNAIEMCIKLMNDKGSEFRKHKQTVIQSLQQTEWDVEVVMDKIPADLAPGGWDVFPKLDANNCLILKRVE